MTYNPYIDYEELILIRQEERELVEDDPDAAAAIGICVEDYLDDLDDLDDPE